MDVRDNFVNLNKWANRKAIPCPQCLPNFEGPPPKNGIGIAHLCAGNDKVLIYYCSNCGTETDRKIG